LNYDDEATDTGDIRFGEELRASPPRHTREIKVQQVAVRVIKPLFQVGDQKAESSSKGSQATLSGHQVKGVKNIVANELVHSIRDMHVVKPSQDNGGGEQQLEGKDRVSFDTNMSTDEESTESESVHGEEQNLLSVVERFHARKSAGKAPIGVERRTTLKVQGAGKTKKQKTPVKTSIRGAVKSLIKDELEENRIGTRSKVEMVTETATPKTEPVHLMGPQEEARKEQ
jgi:hypothetical protein